MKIVIKKQLDSKSKLIFVIEELAKLGLFSISAELNIDELEKNEIGRMIQNNFDYQKLSNSQGDIGCFALEKTELCTRITTYENVSSSLHYGKIEINIYNILSSLNVAN